MSLGDIERRLRVLEQQFQTLLEKATDDPAAYGGQFKEILDEQTFLKEKRSVILANSPFDFQRKRETSPHTWKNCMRYLCISRNCF